MAGNVEPGRFNRQDEARPSRGRKADEFRRACRFRPVNVEYFRIRERDHLDRPKGDRHQVGSVVDRPSDEENRTGIFHGRSTFLGISPRDG
jgi:hypothetical protein